MTEPTTGGSRGNEPCERSATVDWPALQEAAEAAADRAYAPYSKFQVGAAAMVDDGRIITGCNVENASYGLSLCAECGLVSALHATGGGHLVAVLVVSGSGKPCTPCGRCRQLLFEHGGPGCLINGDGTARRLSELLPDGFGPERIAEG